MTLYRGIGEFEKGPIEAAHELVPKVGKVTVRVFEGHATDWLMEHFRTEPEKYKYLVKMENIPRNWKGAGQGVFGHFQNALVDGLKESRAGAWQARIEPLNRLLRRPDARIIIEKILWTIER